MFEKLRLTVFGSLSYEDDVITVLIFQGNLLFRFRFEVSIEVERENHGANK